MIGAFFDIDGTLYRDSLLVEHFKKLIRYEVIDPKVWHSQAKQTFYDWDKRQGNYDDYLMEVVAVYINALKGIKKPEVEFVSNQVIRLKGERVYRYTRQRINWHIGQGHKVIFISGSPDFLVSKMAKKYGAIDFYGSVYHVDHENKFNGEITGMWDSTSKKKAIDHFVRKYNLDLRKSFAYGDTTGDLGMFEKVGYPIAINPAKELVYSILENIKLAEKTEIIVERKDVIYKLKSGFDIM